jgi:hypothetical protein
VIRRLVTTTISSVKHAKFITVLCARRGCIRARSTMAPEGASSTPLTSSLLRLDLRRMMIVSQNPFLIDGRALVSASVDRFSYVSLLVKAKFQIALTVASRTPLVLPNISFFFGYCWALEIILVLCQGTSVMWKIFITAKLAGFSTTWCSQPLSLWHLFL